MPQLAAIRRVGAMVTDRTRWSAPRPGSEYDEIPCALSLNTMHWRGPSEGRRGSRIVFRGTDDDGTLTFMGLTGTGTCQSTGISGAVAGVWNYRSRGGAGIEYVIVAGYNVQSANILRVLVFAGSQILVASQNFTAAGNANHASLADSPTPLTGVGFGDSFYITGPAVQGPTGAPLGFIRVRFQRTGVSIAEVELFDRELIPYSPGDDPGPYVGRVQQAAAMCVFQNRLCLAFRNRVYMSNLADAFGWSATQYVESPGPGDITALAPGDRYLLVLKERGGSVVRGGLRVPEDTSVDVLDQHGVGATTHRGLLTVPGGHITLNHEGVFFIRPGAEPVELSRDIRNFLQGDLANEGGGDASYYCPVRSSFINAPGAYLPGRREVYYALSNGADTPEVGLQWGTLYARPNARSVWLVGHLGDNGARWSIHVGPSGLLRIAESLCGWVDVDGYDRLLFGGYNGRVNIANVGETDQVAPTQTGTGTHTAYTVDRHLAPIVTTASGAVEITHIETAMGDTHYSTSGAMSVRYGAADSDGSFAGSPETIPIIGRNNLPVFGQSYPFALRTQGTIRRQSGFTGVITSDGLHLDFRGPQPLYGLTVFGSAALMAEET